MLLVWREKCTWNNKQVYEINIDFIYTLAYPKAYLHPTLLTIKQNKILYIIESIKYLHSTLLTIKQVAFSSFNSNPLHYPICRPLNLLYQKVI